MLYRRLRYLLRRHIVDAHPRWFEWLPPLVKFSYSLPLPGALRTLTRITEKLLMPERIYRMDTIQPGDLRLRLRLGDSIQSQIYYRGIFEPQITRLFCSAVKPNSMVVDVGAHCGQYALLASRAQPDVEVHAFEPDAESIDDLRYNLQINGINNVHVYPVAVADTSGTLMLYDDRHSFGFSNHSLAAGTAVFKDSAHPVEVVMLDAVFCNAKRAISVIKMDIEGAELLALRGAEQILRSSHPVLFLEVDQRWTTNFNYSPDDLRGYLAGLGYDCYWVDERGKLHRIFDAASLHEWNWMALPAGEDAGAMLHES